MIEKSFLSRSFRVIRDFITFRALRKQILGWIKRRLFERKVRSIAKEIDSQFRSPVVYIFQMQFFDANGVNCFNGGAERYCVDLSAILKSFGYTPVLVQMGCDKLWYRKIKELNIVGVPFSSCDDYMCFIALLKKYEFVIYSGFVDWGVKSHPNILVSHGITWDVPKRDVLPLRILKMVSDVDCLVSVDTNTISWLRSTFSATLMSLKTQMHYVPNYVDTVAYKYVEKKRALGEIKILFPRRCSYERGYWLMSEAIPRVLNKYPSIVFDFIGFAHGEKITADLKRLIKMFPGRINHNVFDPDDMAKVYQNADISIIPTLYAEGTSLSCLEAMACGNIVIATNIGGLPNLIINKYNGFLVNPVLDELILAIDDVVTNLEHYDYISKNGVLVAQTFSKNAWAEKWCKIIQNI